MERLAGNFGSVGGGTCPWGLRRVTKVIKPQSSQKGVTHLRSRWCEQPPQCLQPPREKRSFMNGLFSAVGWGRRVGVHAFPGVLLFQYNFVSCCFSPALFTPPRTFWGEELQGKGGSWQKG